MKKILWQTRADWVLQDRWLAPCYFEDWLGDVKELHTFKWLSSHFAHLCWSPSVSVLQFTSRLTSPSPDVCQVQRWPSLVVSSPEPSTERFLLAGCGDGGGWRGLSGFLWPCCFFASQSPGRQRRSRRKMTLYGRTLMVAEKPHEHRKKENGSLFPEVCGSSVNAAESLL